MPEFAELKECQGWRRVRYRGVERNALGLCMSLVALNLRRVVSLAAR